MERNSPKVKVLLINRIFTRYECLICRHASSSFISRVCAFVCFVFYLIVMHPTVDQYQVSIFLGNRGPRHEAMNIIHTFYLNIFTSVLMIAQRITLARRLMLLTSHFLKTCAHNIHIIFSKRVLWDWHISVYTRLCFKNDTPSKHTYIISNKALCKLNES